MPVGTLLNDEDRSRLIRRLQRVRPGAEPAWGTLNAPRMLCHLADQMRVALGDLPAKPVHERVGTGTACAVHPMFGPLSPEEWGRLCWKHLNHHLLQFGV
jgi:hypothetical protein